MDFIGKLRKVTKTPIIVCSKDINVDTRVGVLNAGVDDYIVKPFHKNELVARIHSTVRRSKNHAESLISEGNIAINLTAKACLINGQSVHLTRKEYTNGRGISIITGRKTISISGLPDQVTWELRSLRVRTCLIRTYPFSGKLKCSDMFFSNKRFVCPRFSLREMRK